MTEVIIDVREHDEYKIEHIKDSISVPLSNFSAIAPGVLNQLKDRKIIFMCYSGIRASQAFEQAKQLGYIDQHDFSTYPGGIKKWKESGHPVQKAEKLALPLMRQMQIAVGTLLVIFALLGAFVNQWFSMLTVVFGGGLLLAGITGDCAVASLLAKAPWNKADPSLSKTYCQAAGKCEQNS